MEECALYSDPVLYDSFFPNAGGIDRVPDRARRERIFTSERFYIEQAQARAGRVLELGCGSGRLTIPIAQAGIEIVGADLSLPMLRRARDKAAEAGLRTSFVQADMRRFAFAARFATILSTGNSLLHLLTEDDLTGCLAAVRAHLAPEGRFVFDVANWSPDEERRTTSRAQHPERGEIEIEEIADYDPSEQIRTIVWRFAKPGESPFRTLSYRLRVLFPSELEALLHRAGFRLEARYADFTRQPFGNASRRQVCVCA